MDELSIENFEALLELVSIGAAIAFIDDDGDIRLIADVHATDEHRRRALSANEFTRLNNTGECE